MNPSPSLSAVTAEVQWDIGTACIVQRRRTDVLISCVGVHPIVEELFHAMGDGPFARIVQGRETIGVLF